MPTIGLVDDREDMRNSTRKMIGLELRKLQKEWDVIDIHPFTDTEDYYPWIRENAICLLLVDERLHESKNGSSKHVSYNGHTLVANLRERYTELPIIAITSYADDANLQKSLNYFDNIIDRRLFIQHPKEHVLRFLRFGQKFIDAYSEELKSISTLSTRIAQNTELEGDRDKLSVLQIKLGLINQSKEITDRTEWLKEFEKAISNLELFRDEIIKKIDSKL